MSGRICVYKLTNKKTGDFYVGSTRVYFCGVETTRDECSGVGCEE